MVNLLKIKKSPDKKGIVVIYSYHHDEVFEVEENSVYDGVLFAINDFFKVERVISITHNPQESSNKVEYLVWYEMVTNQTFK